MSNQTESARSALATLLAARTFNRRTIMKSAAAAGAVTLVAPAYISNARATSGELNVMFWSDELPEDFLKAFTEKTGIKVNFTGFGSNEELVNKMKATKGEGFDIVSPTLNRVLQWKELAVTQPWDMSKVALDRLNPAMVKAGEAWNFDGKGQQWLPYVWGTEGISWRTDLFTPKGEFPSYGDIWAPENAGKTMGRAQGAGSVLIGLGLSMEGEGKLPAGSMLKDAYSDETKMRAVWDKVIEVALANKKNIKVLWNDADRAPKEGAMAWVDGMSLPTGAKNFDQAYAFLDFAYTPENAGMAIAKHGYNSPVIGADKFAGDKYAKNFAEAYPGDALSRLNPWPPEPAWYVEARKQYKFLSA
jgi:spermidine/putrescine transport system substrate-binding protein